MKIWLDPALLLYEYAISNQGGHPTSEPDCPVDCPKDDGPDDRAPELGRIDMHSIFPIALTEVDRYYLHTRTFIRPQALHVQACGEDLWLACNPSESGKVVLMDAEAHALLESFRTPKTLRDAIAGSSICSSSVEQGVELFTVAGFLQEPTQPALPPALEQAQTLAVWFHITNACNLRCHYCYVDKTTEHMADDTAKQAVDAIIRSASRHGYRHVKLKYAGGEAALRLPQIIAVHDYALEQTRQHGLELSASILSNGTILSVRAIQQLKERQIGIMISLDGIGAHHDQQRPLLNGKGSFALIDRTITRLLAHDLVPYINVTVTQRNLDELPGLMAYILQRDLPFGLSYYRDNACSTHLTNLQYRDAQMIEGMRAVFAYIAEHLPRRRLLSSLVDKADTNGPYQYACGVGRNYFAVDQRGGIAKCQMAITQTLTTIQADDPLRVVREEQDGVQGLPVDEKEGCRSCQWRYWCRGGCPMQTYRMTGRSDIKSPNCAIYKALFPEALRLEALRLLKYELPVVC
ncbi:MAG TPA: radical SAM protein [Ktedonobacteraceae bacterium]|nr:radical SAM protein [Ktedonobacteraceae bacterium]